MPNVLRNNDEPIRTQTDNHRKAMVFLRVFSSLGTAGGIYVCGGFNGTSSTPRAEFLDLQVASRTKGLGWRKLDLIRGAPNSKGIQNRCSGLTVQFPVWWCFWTITLPFIGSSRASKGEASRQPNTMVLKHILAPAAVTAKFPKVRLCESQTPRPLVFAFPSMRPCWWPGSVNRDIFAKVLRRSGRKSKCMLKGLGQ